MLALHRHGLAATLFNSLQRCSGRQTKTCCRSNDDCRALNTAINVLVPLHFAHNTPIHVCFLKCRSLTIHAQQLQNNRKHFSDVILKPSHAHLLKVGTCSKVLQRFVCCVNHFIQQGIECKLLHCCTAAMSNITQPSLQLCQVTTWTVMHCRALPTM